MFYVVMLCYCYVVMLLCFNSIKEINRLRKEINTLLSKGMLLNQLKK